MKTKGVESGVGCAIALMVVFVLPLWVVLYRSSAETMTITVNHRERVVTGSGNDVSSYYLVWTEEGEVFKVADSTSFLSFDASDRYGRLKEGTTHEVQVAGWRIPWASSYRNIVEVR